MNIKEKLPALVFIALTIALLLIWLSPTGIHKSPQISLSLINGKKINLTDFHGKPVLITFWATTCPGCISEMPHLVKLYQQYSSKGLKMIAIAMSYDNPEHIKKMAQNKKLPYYVAFDNTGEASQAFGDVKLTPTHFLIDPTGKIIRHQIGELNINDLMKQISPFLKS